MSLDLSADKPAANTLADATAITDAFTKIETYVNTTMPPLAPGYELAYAEYDAVVNVTTFSNAGLANTLLTLPSVTFDGSTPVMVEFFAPWANPGTNSRLRFWLFDGSAVARTAGLVYTPSTTDSHMQVPVRLAVSLTPAAGAHVYSFRADFDSANAQGTVGAGNPFSADDDIVMWARIVRR